MGFNITEATEDDIAELAYIHVQGWKDAYGGIIDQPYLDSLDVKAREEQWRGWFDPEETPVFIARDEQGKAAGFVNCGKLKTPIPGSSKIRPPYSGEIYALYILSNYWRKNLGTQLIKTAAKKLAEKKHKSMCLWVLKNNKRAVSFYNKNGGERCGKQNIEIGSQTALEVCFGWRDLSLLTNKENKKAK